MTYGLEQELRSQVFYDPSFFGRFLSSNPDGLTSVLKRCRNLETYDKKHNHWKSNDELQPNEIYITRALNSIKHMTEIVMKASPVDPLFHRGESIHTNCDFGSDVIPSLALYDQVMRHWEVVRMIVMIRPRRLDFKNALRYVFKCACCIFANQPHRRYVYALTFCGAKITFMRIDRAGVLFSPALNFFKDAPRFTAAFANLMMMDDEEFGYDPLFSTHLGETGPLQYYVNLPEQIFSGPDMPRGRSDTTATSRKFKVVEPLCHRRELIGRGTVALLLRQVKPLETLPGVGTRGQKRKFEEDQPEQLYDESYVLKLCWRGPEQEPEGPALEQAVGVYGVVQCAWHCDVERSHEYGGSIVDETTQIDRLFVPESFIALDHTHVDADPADVRPTIATRAHRVYTRVLMSTVGQPIESAVTLRDLLRGMLDAILGHWGLVNKNILHRDISGGNIMLNALGQSATKRRRVEQSDETPETLSESEAKLQEYIEQFDREPTGMLTDLDMHMQLPYVPPVESEPEESSATRRPSQQQPVEYRRGTVPFMAVRVQSLPLGQQYEHTFWDDLESFYWVLLYNVAERVRPGSNRRSATALSILVGMDGPMDASRKWKAEHLSMFGNQSQKATSRIQDIGNDWTEDNRLQDLLYELGWFFSFNRDQAWNFKPIKVYPKIVNMFLKALGE